MDFKHLRKNYSLKKLARSDLKKSPEEQFLIWLEEAFNAEVHEANAAALATASAKGIPSCRTVLLKYIDDRGFVFFTNYKSRKSREIEENPHAAMTFFWREFERQICIEGTVEKISDEESEEYFLGRPRQSRISAWVSKQGCPVKNRDELEQDFLKTEKKFEGTEVPRPEFWGGFRLIPSRIEFWQGRENRMHDRFSYTKEGIVWKIERLAP